MLFFIFRGIVLLLEESLRGIEKEKRGKVGDCGGVVSERRVEG
jgi:hypothetical protein